VCEMAFYAVWAKPVWKGAPQREFLVYTVDCDEGESSSVAIDFVRSGLDFCWGRGGGAWRFRAVAVTIPPTVFGDSRKGVSG
jgi:hypothetical protein